MPKIIGLRGYDGTGDAAADAAATPPPDPPRPAMTLAGSLMLIGSLALGGYIFWATLQKPKRRSGFARNGRRRYRKKARR
jgi:hypothetical protein